MTIQSSPSSAVNLWLSGVASITFSFISNSNSIFSRFLFHFEQLKFVIYVLHVVQARDSYGINEFCNLFHIEIIWVAAIFLKQTTRFQSWSFNHLLHLAGLSKNAPPRDYSLESSESARIFSAFTSISIIAAIFGNGILPEIQVNHNFCFIF